jgi:DNA-binding transcriptional ArsR family regulator
MLEKVERIMKAASDGTRLRILNILGPGPLCVCEIVETIGLSQSTVSKHLSILKAAGLIRDEKRGKWAYYELSDDRRDPLVVPVLSLVLECAGRDPAARKEVHALGRLRCGPDASSCRAPSHAGRRSSP